MSSFSRVIARPKPNAKQPVPDVVVAESGCFHGTLYGIDLPFLQHPEVSCHSSRWLLFKLIDRKSIKPATQLEQSKQHRPWPSAEQSSDYRNHPDDFAKPFPRLFTLSRTASLRSMPSLCSDDSFTESNRSLSPASPQSPPPTRCSTMAVLGSADHLSSFADEYDSPEADPEFMRQRLRENRSLRRQARMRDGDFRDTDNERDYSVSEEPIAITYALSRRVPSGFAPDEHASSYRRVSGVSSPPHASRLSQRVKTPPPLNVAAIRAHTLLAKLLGRQYDVEIGDVDGSILSDSRDEADDEAESDSPRNVRTQAAAVAGEPRKVTVQIMPVDVASAEAGSMTICGRPARVQPKKSYAAVLAASS
ncbi:hypothetical protein BN946_scf184884.g13 [Trametes cinnabarina]|uniref:Uncharacterized protein n=1 Tax=Pycnoporus cinnabarinus TaxID=5643 RepID=A0A060SC61_PYCCI|nr:hypothetical protein BN946_scf184884.g13 [Trametes cinnabarina]